MDPDNERQDGASHSLLAAAAELSDAALLRHVVALAANERAAAVELVAHLAELDSRRLYLAEGFGSLFSYCTGALRLAEHAAYNRIEAARASRRFPALLDLLACGALNLSTVRLLAPHLRRDNFDSLVAAARGKSKRDVELLVARVAPRPDVPPSVRRIAVAQPEAGAQRPAVVAQPGAGAQPGPAMMAPGREVANAPSVIPLAPERFVVKFTIGAATHDKLRQVQQLLRREIPDGDPGAIFDRALTLLVEDVTRKKLGAAKKPRGGSSARTSSRHIPARVKREVWSRDGGRCAFVAAHGRRCEERAFLEFHHQEPYGIGGEPTVGNISLRCRAHNMYEAEIVFGRRPQRPPGSPHAPELARVWRPQVAAGGAQRPVPVAGARNSPRGESAAH